MTHTLPDSRGLLGLSGPMLKSCLVTQDLPQRVCLESGYSGGLFSCELMYGFN